MNYLEKSMTPQPAATRQYRAPYSVVGFKGGYLSLVAAIKAAKARGTIVIDADRQQCWAPARYSGSAP